MNRLFRLCVLCLIFSPALYSQNASWNMDKLGEWSDPSLPYYNGIIYNDIWGYTDENGNEFAIIGSAEKIHFIDITDPSSIYEVANFIGGNNSKSIWRDIKTYGDYAYAVADQGTEGLMIFDMSNLPASVAKVYQSDGIFKKAHNIFIDEDSGRLYVLGSNLGYCDIIVFDIATDPENPILIGTPLLNGGSIHDAYVRNDTVYTSHGNAGLYVYDMTDAANPLELGTLVGYLNSGYNHSSWLNEDGTTLVFCDETHGRKVKAIDVTDLTDMEVTASNLFYSNLVGGSPLNSIAHNPMIKGDYVYVSYYQDGVQVFDITDITNVVKVAYYDTYPDNVDNSDYNGYAGDWGVFTQFDSGKIITSDDTYGLTVLELSSPLPVGLQSFEVEQQDQATAQISWITSHEENSDFFEVQHSSDGKKFSSKGIIPAAGNSEIEKRYVLIDENLMPGINYYRLRQVDFDGRANYSEVRSLEFYTSISFSILPTVVSSGESLLLRNELEIIPSDLIFELYNAQGNLMSKINLDSRDPEFFVPTKNFAAGTYMAIVNKKGTPIFTQKIVITD